MSDIVHPVRLIGGNAGWPFCHNAGVEGRVLRKIGVWVGGWFVGGIRVWWTGLDTPNTFGTPNVGSYKEFTFQDGETITSLSLWGNGAGTRSGGIRFRTSRGNEFFHHMTKWGLKQEYPVDIASGLCVGLIGNHGEHIDCVGFMFLRSIASARMINVTYPTLDLETAGIVPVTLDSMTDNNNAGSISKNWAFRGSREVKMTSAWSVTAGIEVHASLTVTAGIPMVAEVAGEFGWTVSTSATYSRTHEETRGLQWEQSGVLQPGEWISLQALTRRGTITLPYQATMQITLQNGTVFSYPIHALYAGVDYTSVQIQNHGTFFSTSNMSGEFIPRQPMSLPASATNGAINGHVHKPIKPHYTNVLPDTAPQDYSVIAINPHYKNIPHDNTDPPQPQLPQGVVEERTLVY